MTDLQDGNPSNRRGSMVVCEGIYLGLNGDTAMHIISSLYSMDETSRLFL